MDEEKISIEGLSKAAVLAALYNHSRPQGLGFLHFTPEDMTQAEAQKHIEAGGERRGKLYFDYLQGRVIKVDLSGDSFAPWLYDRDNGKGAAQHVIEQLRAQSKAA